MPRRRVAAKREIIPDPKFGSERLARFMNVMMISGKKAVAESIVYQALDAAFEKLMAQRKNEKEDDEGEGGVSAIKGATQEERMLSMFDVVLESIRPTVEVRSRRVGGATYQIPCEVRTERGMALAMRWLVQAARGRSEQGMTKRLANEIVDAINGRGSAIKKREDTHRMAKANQAFAHFRWN